MNDIYSRTPIRIPVKLVDGQWEFFYGGVLPIKDGAVGDLLVDRSSIVDKNFLALLKQTSEHKIFDIGTELLVALTIKKMPNIDSNLETHLIPMIGQNDMLGADFFHTIRSPETQFVKIRIGEPTPRQKIIRPSDSGGVWLHLQGSQPKGIFTSSVIVPSEISSESLESLNHAFTRLSEKFEPWRKSHTGNIYDRVLYREKNGRWYPLNVLRNAAIARDEHELIREQWALLSKQLQLNFVFSDSKD